MLSCVSKRFQMICSSISRLPRSKSGLKFWRLQPGIGFVHHLNHAVPCHGTRLTKMSMNLEYPTVPNLNRGVIRVVNY